MATDSEVSGSISSALGSYLPLSGGTMSGNIALAEGKTVDGYDVGTTLSEYRVDIDNHETRIDELEVGADDVSSSQLARAHLSYKAINASSGTILESYNIASVTPVTFTNSCGDTVTAVSYTVTFSSPFSSSNYSVIVTPQMNGAYGSYLVIPGVLDKQTNSLVVKLFAANYSCETLLPHSFDLVAFAN
jgi:hypothetical protein